jgi:hypothetical protein
MLRRHTYTHGTNWVYKVSCIEVPWDL